MAQDGMRAGLKARRRARWHTGVAVAALALALVGGCDFRNEGHTYLDSSAGGTVGTRTNAALAALALGDLPRAEGAAENLLTVSPDDPYGLLVLATVYERTARPRMAREVYMQLDNLPIDRPISSVLWANGAPTTVQAIAHARLQVLPSPRPTFLPPPTQAVLTARGPSGPLGEGTRDRILVSLHRNHLITDSEYSDREAAVEHGAARHLGPAPSYEEISDRLKQLRETLDRHEMTVDQFTNERETILNGIVPLEHAAAPALPPASKFGMGTVPAPETRPMMGTVTPDMAPDMPLDTTVPRTAAEMAPQAPVAVPAPTPPASGVPPQSLLPAPDTGNPAATLHSGRQDQPVVPDPAAGAPVAQGDIPPRAQATEAATPPALAAGAPPAAGSPPPPTSEVVVRLASFRTERAVQEGWDLLRAKYPSLMGLQLRVTPDDSSGQGKVFHLDAGPLATVDIATDLCRKLAGQFCQPMTLSSTTVGG